MYTACKTFVSRRCGRRIFKKSASHIHHCSYKTPKYAEHPFSTRCSQEKPLATLSNLIGNADAMALTAYADAIVRDIRSIVTQGSFQNEEITVSEAERYDFPPYCKVNVSGEVKVSGKLLCHNITDFSIYHVKEYQTASTNLSDIAKAAVSSPLSPVDTSNLKVLNDFASLELNATPSFVAYQPQNIYSVDLALSTKPELRVIGGIIRFAGANDLLRWCAEGNSKGYVRTVLTPSYSRYGSSKSWITQAQCAQHWGSSNIPTLHIVLCRPFQFPEYVKRLLPLGYIIASMPDDEESVGSARYWCMVVARALNPLIAFIIDDSLLHKNTVKIRTRPKVTNYQILDAVMLLEKVIAKVNTSVPGMEKIGLISFRRWGHPASKDDPSAKIGFGQGFQCLHVNALFEKGVFFRRKMFYGEDVAFSQLCLNNGLASIQIPHIEFYDNTRWFGNIGTTGCSSPFQSSSPASPASASIRRISLGGTVVNSPTTSAKTITTGDEVDDDLTASLSYVHIAEDENSVRAKTTLFPTAREEDDAIATNLGAAKRSESAGAEPETDQGAVNAVEEKGHVSTEDTSDKGEDVVEGVKGSTDVNL